MKKILTHPYQQQIRRNGDPSITKNMESGISMRGRVVACAFIGIGYLYICVTMKDKPLWIKLVMVCLVCIGLAMVLALMIQKLDGA